MTAAQIIYNQLNHEYGTVCSFLHCLNTFGWTLLATEMHKFLQGNQNDYNQLTPPPKTNLPAVELFPAKCRQLSSLMLWYELQQWLLCLKGLNHGWHRRFSFSLTQVNTEETVYWQQPRRYQKTKIHQSKELQQHVAHHNNHTQLIAISRSPDLLLQHNHPHRLN